MPYGTRYPNTVAIAKNREEIASLLRRVDVQQVALDGIARTDKQNPAFEEKLGERDALLAALRDKVAETNSLLRKQVGKGTANQAVIGQLQRSLSRVEKRTAVYQGVIDHAYDGVEKIQGELESSELRMGSYHLQLILAIGGVILVLALSASSLVSAAVAPQEIVIVVGVGVLMLYFLIRRVISWIE